LVQQKRGEKGSTEREENEKVDPLDAIAGRNHSKQDRVKKLAKKIPNRRSFEYV